MTAESLINLILLFFAYAFLGWCIEVTLKYFQFHRFINRGFLTGPWLPIYGSGAALITIVVKGLSPLESSAGTTFLVSFVLCGIVEYMTSFVLEKRFHARWWDYSQKPMNLHDRVWIGNLILFGLGGVLIVELINPLLARLSGQLSFCLRETVAIVLSCIFAADYVMSHFVLKLVKIGVESSEADDTEAINKEIRLLLNDRSFFHRRFAEAYPEVLYRTERIAARVEAIKAETERLRLEAEQRAAEIKHEVEVNLEPTALVKNTIIEKQEALIDLLYQEDTASDEMKALKREVEEKQAVLQKRRDAVLKLGLDVFFIDILADVEASGHGTRITLLVDDLALLVLALFFKAFGRGDRQVAVLQLQIDLIFLEARQVHFQLIAFIVFLQIRLHHMCCMFAIQLAIHIGFKTSERETHPVIKQTLSKNTR